MTEYTTIRVSKDAKEAAQEAKRDGETWNEYLQRCTDTQPNVQEFVPVEEVVGRDVPAESVDWDKINEGLKETIQNISTPVELEATEYRKIADEVAGRLR